MPLSLCLESEPQEGTWKDSGRAAQQWTASAVNTLVFGLQSSLSLLYKVAVLPPHSLLKPPSTLDLTRCLAWETSGLCLRPQVPFTPLRGSEATDPR